MNKNLIIVLLVIAGLIFFVIGVSVGVVYKTEKDAPLLEKSEKMTEAVKKLSSKAITSIIVYGEVTNIENRDITLAFANESLTVSVKENSQIFSFTPAEGGASPNQRTAEFKDIKKGDFLNVSLRLLADGQLEGVMAIILPPVSRPR